MPADKTLSQRYQEMVEILRELTDSMARIEERLEFYSEKHDKLEEKVEKHLIDAAVIISNVTKLELASGNITHAHIVDQLHEVKTRLTTIEVTFKDFPHSEVIKDIQAIKQDLAPYRKLLEDHKDVPVRLKMLETADISTKNRWKTLGTYGLNMLVYLIGVLIASYLLWLWKLQPPNVP